MIDAATGMPWTGAETAPASASGAAAVTTQTDPATGDVTYQFFQGGSCAGDQLDSVPVPLNADGSVPPSNIEGPLAAGTYSFLAGYSGDGNYDSSVSSCESFVVNPGTPSTPSITNIPAEPTEFGSFAADVSTDGDGTTSVTSSTPAVCVVDSGRRLGLRRRSSPRRTARLRERVQPGHGDLPGGRRAGVQGGGRLGWVFSFGDAPFLGGMASKALNGPIIAADGF